MKLVILFLRCTRLKEKFPFIDEPLSEEEKEFPLAYGILVYKSAFQVYMMMSAIYHNIKPPLTLWKSSMSSLVPREAANVLMASPKVHELMRFLQHSDCSDEAVWTTITGNPQELKIPGGFNAAAFHFERTECLKHKKGNITAIIEQEVKAMAERHPNEPFLPDNYYISRYQVWGTSTLHKCYCRFFSLCKLKFKNKHERAINLSLAKTLKQYLQT
uniref:Uncharacterized protein n=1 Tax=Meloidogyne enterolobii TaxID=390850 RepID=A0A6V7XFE8_MELEN|nr:unnamed protein product [Meloidogyne enterolobii]